MMKSESLKTVNPLFLNSKFNPNGNFNATWWCPNGHWHTIAGNFLGKRTLPGNELITIPTNDGDFLEINYIESNPESAMVILLHGLEGSSHSYYVAELADTLYKYGYSSIAMNFRGCGPHMNRLHRFYHSGDTADFNCIIQWAHEKWPQRMLAAVGFSLGANVLLKWLGEQIDSVALDGAVAVSAPFDLGICSDAISSGFNRVYEQYFMLSLKKKLRQKKNILPDMPDFNGHTLRDFDDQITAKLHGFEDAEDYYQKASCAPYVDKINASTLIIHSRQDPICPIESVPLTKISQNPKLESIITQNGGHVGFIDARGKWLNETILEYLEWIAPL